MRHALAHEIVGNCQLCEEALTSRDIMETGQAKLCPDCLQRTSRLSWQKVTRPKPELTR